MSKILTIIKSKSFLALLLTLLNPLLFSSLITTLLLRNSEQIETFGTIEWVFITLGTVLTMAIAFTPTTFIAIVFGYFLNMKALIYIIPAYFVASFLGFSIGKKINGENLLNLILNSKKKEDLYAKIHHSEFMFMIFARISPILPFAFMNLCSSYLKVSLKQFFWGGTIGMLPRTILSVFIGSQLQDFYLFLNGDQPKDPNMVYLSIFLLVVSVVGMYFVFRGKKDRV